jgi:hypothetical protein
MMVSLKPIYHVHWHRTAAMRLFVSSDERLIASTKEFVEVSPLRRNRRDEPTAMAMAIGENHDKHGIIMV